MSDWSSDVCSSDLVPEVLLSDETDEGIRQQFGVGAIDPLKMNFISPSWNPIYHIRAWNAEIGTASCRERVCQYASISVVPVSLNKTAHTQYTTTRSSTQRSAVTPDKDPENT